jgi:hypothetical protein
VQEFEVAMDNIARFVGPACRSFLENETNVEKRSWTTAFSDVSTWGITTSNHAESFASWISRERNRNIYSCLYGIIRRSIDKYSSARAAIEEQYRGVSDSLLPPGCKRANIFATNVALGSKCREVSLVDHVRQSYFVDNHIVHMQQKMCSCRQYDMQGVPCRHACAILQRVPGLRIEKFAKPVTLGEFKKCFSKSVTFFAMKKVSQVCSDEVVMPPTVLQRGRKRKSKVNRINRREVDHDPRRRMSQMDGFFAEFESEEEVLPI